jgi:hypothetical protein
MGTDSGPFTATEIMAYAEAENRGHQGDEEYEPFRLELTSNNQQIVDRSQDPADIVAEIDREAHLEWLAGLASGLHYDSPEAREITGLEDWSDYYPVVDREGLLTGAIVDAQADGFYNVANMGMIDGSELTAAERRAAAETGYAEI